MKAETGEVQSQAKDTWSPQKLGGWVGSPPGGSGEIGSFWHPELSHEVIFFENLCICLALLFGMSYYIMVPSL